MFTQILEFLLNWIPENVEEFKGVNTYASHSKNSDVLSDF